MTIEKIRQKALTWWRDLNSEKKVEYWTQWKNGLPQTNLKKNWKFAMISGSTSAITEIYSYLHT